MIVDVVAHVLDEFRDQMSTDRLMLTSLDGDSSRAIVACVGTDSRESFALQTENERGAELEGPPALVLPELYQPRRHIGESRFGLRLRLSLVDR